MKDNVRPSLLLVLDLAAEGGESSLSSDTIKKRIQRGRLSKRLIAATADKLVREGFVSCVPGPDRRYALSRMGEQWLQQRFGSEAIASRRFVPLNGSSDLPDASPEYRAAVRREALQKLAIGFVPLVLLFVLMLVLR